MKPTVVDTGSEWQIDVDVGDLPATALRVEVDHGTLTIRAGARLVESVRLPANADVDSVVATWRPGGALSVRAHKLPSLHRVVPIDCEGTLVHTEATPC